MSNILEKRKEKNRINNEWENKEEKKEKKKETQNVQFSGHWLYLNVFIEMNIVCMRFFHFFI